MNECEKMTVELIMELDKLEPSAIERIRDKTMEHPDIKQHPESVEFMQLLFGISLERALKRQKA